MTLMNDTYDCCGGRFDAMGDPLLVRRPDLGRWHVWCHACTERQWGETVLEQAKAKVAAGKYTLLTREQLRALEEAE